MTHSELLEQHEARLRLYVRLLNGMKGGASEEARETVLELVRREVVEAEEIAQLHMDRLAGDQEREAFRYALTMLLPYYTHLARMYGRRHPAPRAAAAMAGAR